MCEATPHREWRWELTSGDAAYAETCYDVSVVPKDESFKNYVKEEVLRDVDGVTFCSMFGWWGIYRHSVFFSLITDDTLYFKVDETTKIEYEKMGSQPFVYQSPKGKPMTMICWQLPESIMENPSEIIIWADKAYQVALKSKKKKLS